MTGHQHKWDERVAGDYVRCACGEQVSGLELAAVGLGRPRTPEAVEAAARAVLRARKEPR